MAMVVDNDDIIMRISLYFSKVHDTLLVIVKNKIGNFKCKSSTSEVDFIIDISDQ